MFVFGCKLPTKIPPSYPLTCWDTVQLQTVAAPARLVTRRSTPGAIVKGHGRRACKHLTPSLGVKTPWYVYRFFSTTESLRGFMHVCLWCFFCFFCRGFSQSWYNHTFLRLRRDLTLASWLWTRYMKGERLDFGAAGKPKKILRRGVSDSDFTAFIFPLLVCQNFSAAEMISQAGRVFVCPRCWGSCVAGSGGRR